MWRYLAGGLAALLMMAAGWTIYSSRARPDPILPPMPVAAPQRAEAGGDAPVPEASERSREEMRFDRYDKDRDDRITRAEYLTSRRKAFAKLDTNGDGKLSFEEWAIRTTTKFDTADRDKSGAMNRAEFATTAVKRSARTRCVCAPAGPAVEE